MSTSKLTGDDVARTWLKRGIADLYFGFHTMGKEFSAQAMFMQIMALEKHLKAVLLFERRAEFESMSAQDARVAVNSIAKKLSHRFPEMLDEAERVSRGAIRNVRGVTFGIFEGAALLKSLTEGYEETRYPVPVGAWRSHPVSGYTDTYHDPLDSSDADSLIYSVCTDCFRYLEGFIAEPKQALAKISERFAEQESFVRFQRLYLPGRW